MRLANCSFFNFHIYIYIWVLQKKGNVKGQKLIEVKKSLKRELKGHAKKEAA